MTSARREPIWTPTYSLLCLSVGLVYVQYSLLAPSIPLYVRDHGWSNTLAGLVLLSFSVPSFSVRPLVGYWADAWNAAGILALGSLLLGAGTLLYLLPFVGVLFLASIIRGLGWAGLNTGGYTVLAAVSPPSRRGEASGYYTTMQGTVGIVFPALALWLLDRPTIGFGTVFTLAGCMALSGALVGWLITRRPDAPAPVPPAPDSSPSGSGFLDRGVLLATGLQLCATLAFPAVAAFLPLFARSLGIEHIFIYYIVSGSAALVSRPFLGGVEDRIGRGPSIVAGFLTQIIGYLLFVLAHGLPVILAGGICIAVGSTMINASTIALAMDLADPRRRGTAMATYSMAFQIGNGFGSLLAGWLADAAGYRGMYGGAMATIALGLGLAALTWPAIRRAGLPAPETGVHSRA